MSPIDERPTDGDERTWTLADLAAIAWRGRLLILTTVVLTVGGGVAYLLARPDEYRATATAVVLPTAFTRALVPPELTPDGYEQIATSAFVRRRVRDTLRQQGVAEADLRLSFSFSMQPGDVRNRATGRIEFPPLADLTVVAPAPEAARRAANTWAQIAHEATLELAGSGALGALEFVERQYPIASRTFDASEARLQAREDELAAARLELESRSRRETVAFATETRALVNAHQAETKRLELELEEETDRLVGDYEEETERLRLAFLEREKPELVERQLQTSTELLADYERQRLRDGLRLKTLEEQISQLAREVAAQPRYVVVSKAITDEALWASLSGSETLDALPEALDTVRLRSEEPNRTREMLATDLAQRQVEHDALGPVLRHLEGEIAQVRAGIDELSAQVTEHSLTQFALERDRAGGLDRLAAKRAALARRLTDDRATELAALESRREVDGAILQAERDNAVEQHEREARVVLGRLTRERQAAEDAYAQLAERYATATLARAEDPRTVRLGAPAMAPVDPIVLPWASYLVGAVGAGSLVGLALVFLVHGAPVASMRPATGAPDAPVAAEPPHALAARRREGADLRRSGTT